MHTFSAKVGKIDINPCVEVPDEVLRTVQQDAGKEKRSIPVKGTLQGKPFLANVVRYQARWRLYLNTRLRQAANVDVGEPATVGLQRREPIERLRYVHAGGARQQFMN